MADTMRATRSASARAALAQAAAEAAGSSTTPAASRRTAVFKARAPQRCRPVAPPQRHRGVNGLRPAWRAQMGQDAAADEARCVRLACAVRRALDVCGSVVITAEDQPDQRADIVRADGCPELHITAPPGTKWLLVTARIQGGTGGAAHSAASVYDALYTSAPALGVMVVVLSGDGDDGDDIDAYDCVDGVAVMNARVRARVVAGRAQCCACGKARGGVPALVESHRAVFSVARSQDRIGMLVTLCGACKTALRPQRRASSAGNGVKNAIITYCIVPDCALQDAKIK